MTFDKAAYWKDRETKKKHPLAAKLKFDTRVSCIRCNGTDGQMIRGSFFCARECDPNPLWVRVAGWFGLLNWRVVYRDGQRSEPMSRRVATVYKNHFGGILIRTTSPITNPGLS